MPLPEAVAIAKLIKGQVQAEAAERLRAGQEKGRAAQHGKLVSAPEGGDQNTKPPTAKKSRKQIAKAVGIGHNQLAQAASVVENGTPEKVKAMGKKMPRSPAGQ